MKPNYICKSFQLDLFLIWNEWATISTVSGVEYILGNRTGHNPLSARIHHPALHEQVHFLGSFVRF